MNDRKFGNFKKNEEYMVYDYILWNVRDENYFEYLKGRKLMIL